MAITILNKICVMSLICCTLTICTKVNNFAMPIEWQEISLLTEHASMTTIVDSSGSIYLCGGKTSLFSKSSKCIRIMVQKTLTNYFITQTFSGGNGIQSGGEYDGLYFPAKSFTSSTQNEGGIYDNRLCMLSMSDGTNLPKSWCCNITTLNKQNNLQLPSHLNVNVNCEDLRYSITYSYPNRFDSCVVYDKTKNMLYQIGGYYGQNIFDTILCFNLQTETYLAKDECNYGHLKTSLYSVGCTLITDDKSTIITVGGVDTLSTSSSTIYNSNINICKSDNTTCETLSLSLNDGILKPRVFAIDACHIGIVGGVIKMNEFVTISSNINIGNICTETWIYNNILPIQLSEMGIIKTNGIVCLYGGISFDENAQMPMLSETAYCTDLGNETNVNTETTDIPNISPLFIGETHKPTIEATYETEMSTKVLQYDLSITKIESNDLMIHILIGIIGGLIALLLFAFLCIYKMKFNNVNKMVEAKTKHFELNKICGLEITVSEDSHENGNKKY